MPAPARSSPSHGNRRGSSGRVALLNSVARRLAGAVFAVLLATSADNCLSEDAGAHRKVIIDQDAFGPASSNLQAILMVLQANNVDVLGITVTSGDGWRDE